MQSTLADPIDVAWAALRASLEARCRELHDEVRSYPTPIARCDEQLTRVIEERDAAFRQLRRATELEDLRSTVARTPWVAELREFTSQAPATEDPALAEARTRLVAALARR
jgi:hypothetical protein